MGNIRKQEAYIFQVKNLFACGAPPTYQSILFLTLCPPLPLLIPSYGPDKR